MKVQIFPDAPNFISILVSETQTAECRSSKPDIAGSIPVAHSKFFQARSFNRQNIGLQNRSFQFKSERACQLEFQYFSQNIKFFTSLSHAEGKPNRCGNSLESCREFIAYGFESCAFRHSRKNDLTIFCKWKFRFLYGGVAQRNQRGSLRTSRLEVQILSSLPFSLAIFRLRSSMESERRSSKPEAASSSLAEALPILSFGF